jgi:alpha-glucosidase (family GH31 glycosyl hydrolase)
MQEHIPSGYQIRAGVDGSEPALHLFSTPSTSAGPFHFSFEAIKPNLFRTTFFSDSHPLPPHPSVAKPKIDLEDVQITRKEDINRNVHLITINEVEAQVDLSPPCPVISLGFKDQEPLHRDLPHRSYAVDGTGIAHYTRYAKATLHVGLGEKAAPLNLSNRQFTLSATDCFGYDIYRTDPMYKHIPLLINATPNGCIAMFSTSHSRGSYSIGSEMDGLWGPYKVYRQDHGGLEEYLLLGHNLQEIVQTYADLVGYPKLVPRWAFGYLAGGMKYSMLDDPPAHVALMDFADKLKQHDIPCSGFQLSSGYTVSETPPHIRNVFTWNKHRFPDPKDWVNAYHKRGIRIIANVKPYLLANHPQYQKLAAAGALFTKDGKSAVARLWSAGSGESGIGGHIDFTSRAGYEWWYNGIQNLARLGIDCIWSKRPCNQGTYILLFFVTL